MDAHDRLVRDGMAHGAVRCGRPMTDQWTGAARAKVQAAFAKMLQGPYFAAGPYPYAGMGNGPTRSER